MLTICDLEAMTQETISPCVASEDKSCGHYSIKIEQDDLSNMRYIYRANLAK